MTTEKWISVHEKHSYELVDERKIQRSGIFIQKKLAIKLIKDCRKTATHKFRTQLEFKKS